MPRWAMSAPLKSAPDPTSGGPAGQEQSAFGDGQPQFVRLGVSAEALGDDALQNVGGHAGGKAGGIGVENDEQRVVRQHPGHQLHKGIQVVLQLPHLAGGAPAIGGRVHDDGVIASAPADLPLHKLGAVVHDPADGGLLQAGALGVLPGPLDHALGRIHMAHIPYSMGNLLIPNW